jgi:thioredoxin 1
MIYLFLEEINMVKHLTSENFKKETEKGVVIVDYWAAWCGPCKMYGPIFEETSKEVENVTFAKVDVDSNQELAGQSNVRGIPTTIIFKDGVEVERIVGVREKEALKEILKKY